MASKPAKQDLVAAHKSRIPAQDTPIVQDAFFLLTVNQPEYDHMIRSCRKTVLLGKVSKAADELISVLSGLSETDPANTYEDGQEDATKKTDDVIAD